MYFLVAATISSSSSDGRMSAPPNFSFDLFFYEFALNWDSLNFLFASFVGVLIEFAVDGVPCLLLIEVAVFAVEPRDCAFASASVLLSSTFDSSLLR